MNRIFPIRWSLANVWRKRLFWAVLATLTIVLCIVLALLQGRKDAAFSVAGNVIASALVGIVLLLFLDKWLRRNAFFPWNEVSAFLQRKKPSRREIAKFESDRYKDILEKIITDHLDAYRKKKVFSFLLMGPEQSGKTCFARYVNGTPGVRRKFLALEVPYAVVAGNPASLDEVFRWLCDGDERDRLRCRLIVFHAGNSVRQVKELVEKMRVVQERFRKIGDPGTDAIGHQIILMVQFTGRRPLEAISSDFDWDNVLDAVFPLVHIFRHVMDEGIGFRQLMDYYYILNALPGSERPEVVRTLKSLSLGRFTAAVMFVLKEAFGLGEEKFLLPADRRYGSFLLDEVLISGNFGRYDARNAHSRCETRVGKTLRKFRRQMRFFGLCPREVVSAPFFKLWQYLWRKRNNYL